MVSVMPIVARYCLEAPAMPEHEPESSVALEGALHRVLLHHSHQGLPVFLRERWRELNVSVYCAQCPFLVILWSHDNSNLLVRNIPLGAEAPDEDLRVPEDEEHGEGQQSEGASKSRFVEPAAELATEARACNAREGGRSGNRPVDDAVLTNLLLEYRRLLRLPCWKPSLDPIRISAHVC